MMEQTTNKVKHSVTLRIYEDGGIEFEFENPETLPAGKLESYLLRGTRALKREQGKIRHAQKVVKAEAAKAEAKEDAAKKSVSDILADKKQALKEQEDAA